MIAEIHRKSPLTTSEDFLTADVFSTFRYLPAETGIIGFLRSHSELAKRIPKPKGEATAFYHFWPLGEKREPDLLLELNINGVTYHIVIEAKYLSGPSDGEIIEVERDDEIITMGNQLADQMRELDIGRYTVWEEGVRQSPKTLSSDIEHRLLIYLTAHPLRPKVELNRSQALYPVGADRLFWLNWYQVDDYLRDSVAKFSDFPFHRIVEDLLMLLEMKGFAAFLGVSKPTISGVPIGGFWQDRRQPLPSFGGVNQPPQLHISVNGRFFQAQSTGAES